VIADVVQRANVGVREGRNGPCFALEPLSAHRVVRELRLEQFDGDPPPEACVSGAIDVTHSTLPDERRDLIRAEGHSGREGHDRRDYIRTPAVDCDLKLQSRPDCCARRHSVYIGLYRIQESVSGRYSGTRETAEFYRGRLRSALSLRAVLLALDCAGQRPPFRDTSKRR
jgi:hypothetical protein